MGYAQTMHPKTKLVRIAPVLYTKVRQRQQWEDEPFGRILERLLEPVLKKELVKSKR